MELYLDQNNSFWTTGSQMTTTQCKEFIDEEIMSLFEGDDRFIQTYIRGVRNMEDEWYHVVEIYMVRLPHMSPHIVDFGSFHENLTIVRLCAQDDNDLTVGRLGDGWVYYDL